MKKAIVMISLGCRPWAATSFKTFEHYADKIGADAFLITEDVWFDKFDISDVSEDFGRKNKRAYALKAYIPWEFMEQGYDKVLIVDDSCSVHPYAGSIFDEVPDNFVGYAKTSIKHAEISFAMIKDFQNEVAEAPVEFDPLHYANTGVVVYDRKQMDAISPDKIFRARSLLYNKYPHQTLMYYLMKKGSVPIKVIPKKFNIIPGLGLDKNARRSLTSVSEYLDLDRIHIAHFTGAFRNREALIVETADIFLQHWHKALGR